MQTYPLRSLTVQEAAKLQFKVVDSITREFQGSQSLSRGDLGISPETGKPAATARAEKVIARIFDAESAMLVRGAGSGAIRLGLHAMVKCGDKLLIHKAPVYSTTKTTLSMLGLMPVEADFNDLLQIDKVLEQEKDIKGALVQYTRQKPDDRYDMETVVSRIKKKKNIPVLTDDNYAVMKEERTGVQCGADLSCFSSFKLLGPEGVGIIIGKKQYIHKLTEENYSGGMQVQGHEAMDVLRGLTYAPVALAVQAQVGEECAKRLKAGEVAGVRDAFLANAQSKVLLVEFEEEIAHRVLREAQKLGAAPNPVGAESKYELVPMFYRISGTFRQADPLLERRMIRINPMRAGTDTVIRIIKEAMERVSADVSPSDSQEE